MRLDDALRGVALLGFDTPPIIYFIERHPVIGPSALEKFQRITRGDFEGCASVITLTETLTHPKRTQDSAQESAYRTLLVSMPHFLSLPISVPGTTFVPRTRSNLLPP